MNRKQYENVNLTCIMQNGRYQVHMKTITASGTLDRNALAFAVYSELLTALNIID